MSNPTIYLLLAINASVIVSNILFMVYLINIARSMTKTNETILFSISSVMDAVRNILRDISEREQR